MIEKYSEEALLKAIKDRIVESTNRTLKRSDPRVEADEFDEDAGKEETEEEKMERYGQPDYDVE